MKDENIHIRVTNKEKEQAKMKAKKAGFRTVTDYIYHLLKVSKVVIIICLATLLYGCSTAGPFVTNISSDGRGGLNIEKARVKVNFWTDGLETTDTTQEHIQLYQEKISN